MGFYPTFKLIFDGENLDKKQRKLRGEENDPFVFCFVAHSASFSFPDSFFSYNAIIPSTLISDPIILTFYNCKTLGKLLKGLINYTQNALINDLKFS